jgi:L-2,4-diaminobutyric acid acetyltransferase
VANYLDKLKYCTLLCKVNVIIIFSILNKLVEVGDFMFNLESIVFRPPVLEDGMAVFRLVKSCPPLDTNSSYCNLLQCSHFASTSVVAQMNGKIVGFISGYAIPERPDTLFIWQVAVAKQAQGQGLASRMLTHILARPQCEKINYLETTITQDNQVSWALFRRLANTISADFQSSEWMDRKVHFLGQHLSEALVRIGPLMHATKSEKVA